MCFSFEETKAFTRLLESTPIWNDLNTINSAIELRAKSAWRAARSEDAFNEPADCLSVQEVDSLLTGVIPLSFCIAFDGRAVDVL